MPILKFRLLPSFRVSSGLAATCGESNCQPLSNQDAGELLDIDLQALNRQLAGLDDAGQADLLVRPWPPRAWAALDAGRVAGDPSVGAAHGDVLKHQVRRQRACPSQSSSGGHGSLEPVCHGARKSCARVECNPRCRRDYRMRRMLRRLQKRLWAFEGGNKPSSEKSVAGTASSCPD